MSGTEERENIMKRKTFLVRIIFTASLVCLLAAGCGQKEEPEQNSSGSVSETDTSAAETTADPTPTEQKRSLDTSMDITSHDDIMRFLAGDWRLKDTVSGDDIATLSINSNGDLIFKRDSDGAGCEGKIDVTKHSSYDFDKDELIYDDEYSSFEINMSQITEDFAILTPDYMPESESSSGIYHIAIGDGVDYLSFKEIGQDTSYIFGSILQNRDRLLEEEESGDTLKYNEKILFYRENKGMDYPEPAANEKFYGFAWANHRGEFLIEKLDCNTYDTYEEYTDRHFLGGYFTEPKDIGITKYEISSDADFSLVIDTDKLDLEHPLGVYEFGTGADGKITSVHELYDAMYGIYDMGDLEPEFSADGLEFKYNNGSLDVRNEAETTANVIMDTMQVGEWIVVETHINPHVGDYLLYNIYSGRFERTLTGANLTWKNDDITTAVYSAWDTLYDYKGNIIGSTDGTEISEVHFGEDGPGIAVTDFNDKEYYFDEPAEDVAMYKYATYLRHGSAEHWKAFVEEAPEDAIAFVMINPPDDIRGNLGYVESLGGQSEEMFCVVSLENDTRMHLDRGTPDFDSSGEEIWKTSKTIRDENVRKGGTFAYYSIVPEGIPNLAVFVSDKQDGGMFMISPITGENDKCSKFIPSTMTAQEADAQATEVSDDDLSLEDVLDKYREAQDGKYSEEQVLELGLETELIQHAWPFATAPEDLKYLYYDVNDDGKDELLIIYFGYLADIYGLDEDGCAQLAFSCPYRAIANLYPNGYLREDYSYTAANAGSRWYRYDPVIARFIPYIGMNYNSITGEDPGYDYYILNEESDWPDIEEAYRLFGDAPVWMWERSDDLTEEQYNNIAMSGEGVQLPEGDLVSN